ncbi:hypothetical protein GCM10009716_17310 [Streptomyces sodiiphilus]|uniref:LPXTG cell wall anchor domain-containing protein n=1 Tax=Streptomyces sodiiphilus TaxID=226217 RepID=A0ABP5AAG2_9ACTN
MKSLKSLKPLGGRLAAGAAVAVLGLGLGAPVSVAADDSKPANRTSPLTVTPGAGGAGTHVTVKASCQPASRAQSQAFQQPIALKQAARGQWVGTGRIKERGLQVGRSYPVTVKCADGVSISSAFTFTAAPPTGHAAAGFGGTSESNSSMTALAVGSGVAAAGAAGYMFFTRRRNAGNHG